MENLSLKAKNIIKYFYDPDTFQVLKGVSFDVKKGEFLSIIGKSGSGKSTLLYVLSTMDTDYEGSMEINGDLLTGKTQNQLATFRNEHIGFVFQFHYLLPEFTSIQNVMLPALKLGKYSAQEIEHKAYENLRLLDLEDQALKRANKLSGGQQQRVAIARALINNPSIIMGDEPTGNLDSKNSKAVLEIFKELAANYGQTIICVTHDNDFARSTDRIIEMQDGLVLDGYHRLV
ncbi:MAG TPA: ATP-binding protein [Marinilabiliales bacterium]|jgi:lipoprotein-releasing system ATP-binding protein|nr:MAG: ATP-binding protein [Bacteroidetes bacterium GWA2_40_14]OFX58996.1 MAG: ATP-binding protein [Bacteroidetes bacterium GWC2_40_13]OFX71380.1 MAG: ATP-binding protein [Bacteroidetes bacterium GWD2_40_43]OFX91425.1 MAG: ATP-binding protein [Bacteroidetes bacterium GWE2_40_63]OFY19494.1 MAG: ATP-binding protein [Bacteroidetes bacterium GWF2_40_13]OFZ25644.1 MAG: ATP-binding protein [Bacteroidetes bacterium RIFOXYC2_FULL_40_12]HAM97705.1 ATP-binding protein [Marinilabiliales bacterium]